MADRRINYEIAARDTASKVWEGFADTVVDSSQQAEDAVEDLSKAQKDAEKVAVDAAKRSAAAAQKAATEKTAASREVAKAAREEAKAAKEVARAAKAAADEQAKAAKEVAEAAQKQADAVQQAHDESVAAWDGIAMAAAGAAAAIVGSAALLGASIIETGAEFQTLEKRLKGAGDTSLDVSQKMGTLRDLTRQSPFLLKELTEQWIQLETFGLDPANGTMQSLIDTGAALGGEQQKMETIVRALGQAWGKQKLQAEEAMQLVEAGVDVWGILGSELGKTTGELMKMASAGALGRTEIQQLIDGMGRVNAGQAAAQMETWNGQLSNFQGLISDILLEMSDAGVMQAAQDALGSIADEIQRLREEGEHLDLAENLTDAIKALGQSLPDIISGLASITNTVADMLPLIETAGVAIGTMWAVSKVSAYRAAIIQFLVTQAAATSATAAGAAAMTGHAAATGAATAATISFSTASKGLVAFMGGPFGIAIAAAAAAIYAMQKGFDALEESQLRALDAIRESATYERAAFFQEIGVAAREAGMGVEEFLESTVGLRSEQGGLDAALRRAGSGVGVFAEALKRAKVGLVETTGLQSQLGKEIEASIKLLKAEKEAMDARNASAGQAADAGMELMEAEKRLNQEREESARLETEHADRIDETQEAAEGAAKAELEYLQSLTDTNAVLSITDQLLLASAKAMGLLTDKTDAAIDGFEYLTIETGEFNKHLDRKALDDYAAAVKSISDQIAGQAEGALSDSIYLAFTGREDEILDVFTGITDSISSMLADALSASITSGDWSAEGPLGQAVGGLGEGGIGGAVAGIASMAGVIQGGGSRLEGALGGFMSIFSTTGNVYAGLAGAVIGYFSAGGQEGPSTSAFIGPFGGSVAAREQGFTPELEEAWIQARLGEYRTEQMQWINAIRAFGDASLFELLPAVVSPSGERLVEGSLPRFGEDPETQQLIAAQDWTADQIATYFKETWLPQAFQAWAEGPIAEGLRNLGVDDDALQAILADLSLLGDEFTMDALLSVINAARSFNTMMADLDWDSIQSDVHANSMDLFRTAMSPISSEIDLIVAGWETMSLTQRAQEWGSIEEMILQARQAEVQMLQQIAQLQEQITLAIGQQIETLQLGGMTGGQRQTFLEQRIAGLMSELATATSPEQVATLVAQIQQYISALSSELGDALYAEGGTLADHPAVINAREGFESLFESLNWDAMGDELEMSSMDMWRASIAPIADQLASITAGWDDLSLPERAAQWGSIEDQIISARQAEIQMLQQINQIQDSITRSITQQIQDLEFGGLEEGEQRQFLQQRIADLQRDLLSAADPAQVQQITADIQGYIRQLQGLYGDQLYELDPENLGLPGTNLTPAQYLQNLLDQTLGLATVANQGFEDEIQAANDQLITNLTNTATSLGLFNDVLLSSPLLAGMLGALPEGMTAAEYLQGLLDQTLGLATGLNQGFVTEIQTANDELIRSTLEAALALGIFSSALFATFGINIADLANYDPTRDPNSPLFDPGDPTTGGGDDGDVIPPGTAIIDAMAGAAAQTEAFTINLAAANTAMETFVGLMAGISDPATGKSAGMTTEELLAGILAELRVRGAHVVSLTLSVNPDSVVDIVDARIDERTDPGFANG